MKKTQNVPSISSTNAIEANYQLLLRKALMNKAPITEELSLEEQLAAGLGAEQKEALQMIVRKVVKNTIERCSHLEYIPAEWTGASYYSYLTNPIAYVQQQASLYLSLITRVSRDDCFIDD